MTRVKSGVITKKKHKKVLGLAKGYWMTRHKHFKKAKEAVLHSGEYAFSGRKRRKRDFRTLWIIRLNASVRNLGLTYSSFISKLKKANVGIDRKIMSQLAVEQPSVFEQLVKQLT